MNAKEAKKAQLKFVLGCVKLASSSGLSSIVFDHKLSREVEYELTKNLGYEVTYEDQTNTRPEKYRISWE